MFRLFSKGGKAVSTHFAFVYTLRLSLCAKEHVPASVIKCVLWLIQKYLFSYLQVRFTISFICFDTIAYIFSFRTLRKAELPISEDTDCQQAFKVFNGTTQICAGGVKGDTTENTDRYSYFPPIHIDHF